MKLHQVNQGCGEQRLPEPASTTSASVAGVVDGTLEQALHFKRTNRQSAKNKVYTAAKEGTSSVGRGKQEQYRKSLADAVLISGDGLFL